MIIKEDDKIFSFIPISYEFPVVSEYDYYTSNWVNIEFSYNSGEIDKKEIFPALLTFEIHTFIKEIEEIINEDFVINLNPMEPYFDIEVSKKSDFINVKVSYEFDPNDKVLLNNKMNKDELIEFIRELKKEYQNYPER